MNTSKGRALLWLSLALAPGIASFVSSQSAAATPPVNSCARLKNLRVKAVCEHGGQAEVKNAMKAAVDRHNAASRLRLDCKSCHTNTSEFQLNEKGAMLFLQELERFF